MPAQSLVLFAGQAAILRVKMEPSVTGGILTWQIRFRIRESPTATSIILSKTVNSGITIISSQEFEVSITSSDTIALSKENYFYDIWRTDTGTEQPIVPNSTLKILPSVNFG